MGAEDQLHIGMVIEIGCWTNDECGVGFYNT